MAHHVPGQNPSPKTVHENGAASEIGLGLAAFGPCVLLRRYAPGSTGRSLILAPSRWRAPNRARAGLDQVAHFLEGRLSCAWRGARWARHVVPPWCRVLATIMVP